MVFPFFQAAATRALNKHTDLASVLDLMHRVTPNLRAPIVLFTYYNPIMKRGVEKFVKDAKAAGAAGAAFDPHPTFFSSLDYRISQIIVISVLSQLFPPERAKEKRKEGRCMGKEDEARACRKPIFGTAVPLSNLVVLFAA